MKIFKRLGYKETERERERALTIYSGDSKSSGLSYAKSTAFRSGTEILCWLDSVLDYYPVKELKELFVKNKLHFPTRIFQIVDVGNFEEKKKPYNSPTAS